MRNAKLWSLLLAAVLLCGLALGVLCIGADAAGTLELSVGGAGEFATVEAALDSVAEADLSAYESITVKVNGNVTETTSGVLLFGQKTIWKEMGVMMPIIVTGDGSLTFPQGTSSSYRKFASANDITFKDMDLPISSLYTYFFAGNGKLTIDGCDIGTGFKFRFAADNFTADVYEGWDEADYHAMKDEDGHIKSVATIKNGSVTTNEGNTERRILAATVSNVDYEATIGSVKISANNTKAELVLDNVDTAYPNARSGNNPVAETILTLKDCDVKGYRAAGHESNSKTFAGDITVNIIGGTYSAYGRLLNGCTISADTATDKAPGAGNGDVTVFIDGAQPVSTFKTNSNNFTQTTWGTVSLAGDLNVTWKNMIHSRSFVAHNSANVTVGGDYNLTIDGLETGSIAGMFAGIGGDVTQNVENLTIKTVSGITPNVKFLDCVKFGGNITNNFTDCTFGYNSGEYYFCAGSASATEATGVKNITNTLKNVDITTTNIVFVGGNYKGAVNGDITNDVDANCTFSSGFIGGNYNGAVNGNITNTIHGGVFMQSRAGSTKKAHAAYTGGIYTNGNITGKITNHIKDGTFDRCDQGYSAFLGAHQNTAHTIGGGIESVIDGGEFAGYVYAGTRGQPTISNSAEGEPAIKTTINDGVFHGFGGLRGRVQGDVVTVINGGTFKRELDTSTFSLITGGNSESNKHLSGNNVATINGGIFEGTVVNGFANIDENDECVQPGKASMTIYGGTFMDHIFAASYDPSGKIAYAEHELIIDLTKAEAEDFSVFGAVGFSAEAAEGVYSGIVPPTVKVIAPENGADITMGKNTDIYATSTVGALRFHQTEGWEGHDYFFTETNDSTFKMTVSEESDVYGIYGIYGNGVQGGYEISAATLILEERVGIRVLLDPEMVAIYKDNFSYSVAKSGEEPFMQGTELEKWTDPESGETYDSFVIYGIGLGDFDQYFTVNVFGALKVEFSVYELAELAGTVWTGDWKAVADAICNLTTVYTSETGVHDEEALPLLDVVQDLVATRDANVVTAASVSLLMSDAVGIELKATLAEGYASALTVKVNGQLIENALVLDGQTATVTLLFDAAYMSDAFVLEIADASGASIFSLTTSIEKLAGDLAANAENPAQENAQALLYYIQKVAKVA